MLWLLWIVLGIVAIGAIFEFALVIYFLRLTILRKPTATASNASKQMGTNWEQHLPFLKEKRKWFDAQNKEIVTVTSDDGLKLSGQIIFADKPSNKLLIGLHGYTSCGSNDYVALSYYYHSNGYNILLPDFRAHGNSEGKYIGFGCLDRYDVLKWIDFSLSKFGKDCEIYIHGTSMGCSTALMLTGFNLPKNIKGIIADCGFTSAYNVFSYLLKNKYHIPKFPIMNLTSIISKKLAGYGYDECNTIDCVKKTNIPILFIHGEKDDFVPTFMSQENYDACNSPKELLIIENATHAESYYVDTEKYERALDSFLSKY